MFLLFSVSLGVWIHRLVYSWPLFPLCHFRAAFLCYHSDEIPCCHGEAAAMVRVSCRGARECFLLSPGFRSNYQAPAQEAEQDFHPGAVQRRSSTLIRVVPQMKSTFIISAQVHAHTDVNLNETSSSGIPAEARPRSVFMEQESFISVLYRRNKTLCLMSSQHKDHGAIIDHSAEKLLFFFFLNAQASLFRNTRNRVLDPQNPVWSQELSVESGTSGAAPSVHPLKSFPKTWLWMQRHTESLLSGAV